MAQLQKIIQEDDMKQMMMDFASTTQAELEAERGELQVNALHTRARCSVTFGFQFRLQTKLSMAETELEELRNTLKVVLLPCCMRLL